MTWIKMNETSDVALPETQSRKLPDSKACPNTCITISNCGIKSNCEICFQKVSRKNCLILFIVWLLLICGTVIGLSLWFLLQIPLFWNHFLFYCRIYLGWIPRKLKTFILSLNCHFWEKITSIITRVNSWIFTNSTYK